MSEHPGTDSARRTRGELGLAVGLCLLGSCLVLVAASRRWTDLAFTGSPVLPDTVVVLRGSDLVPGVRALALVGLAAVVAVLATRGVGRVAVGAVLAACGAAVVGVVARVRGRFTSAVVDSEPIRERGSALMLDSPLAPSAWLWVCVAGGVVLLVAGALVAVRGRRWVALSRRYEAPAARAQDLPATERSVWEALDRGEDPTRDEGGHRVD